jgi:hypothetical protein
MRYFHYLLIPSYVVNSSSLYSAHIVGLQMMLNNEIISASPEKHPLNIQKLIFETIVGPGLIQV